MEDRTLSLIHFFPSFAYGGQQRRLATLVEGLGPRFRHRIVSLDGDISAAALIEGLNGASIETLKLEKTRFLSVGNINALKSAIAGSGADLVCTYNFGSIEAVIANRIGAGLAHIHHEDGFGTDERDGELTRRVIARRVLLANARVVTPSYALEKVATESWRIPPARVFRITPGIDLQRFRVAPRDRRSSIVVGSIGALRPEKNFLRLVRCFEKAAAKSNARLVICGDGPERARLEGAISQSPLRERISLTGPTSAPETALAQFDIFALTSDTEQTPISMIEAMAASLPVIATDVGDVALMLALGDEKSVYDIDDETGFSQRLEFLIDNEEERRSLGERNRVRAGEFDRRGMIEAFGRLYREAVSER
ncbi:MAG: glycosyltransferase [Parvularculaceae bacterium]|nr:glycosyltransferase [Parvularculaceae bacterium]